MLSLLMPASWQQNRHCLSKNGLEVIETESNAATITTQCSNHHFAAMQQTITLLRLYQSTNIKQDLLLCKNIIYPE